MSQTATRRSNRSAGTCARCGITTTSRPVRNLRLCPECRRDDYYVIRASA